MTGCESHSCETEKHCHGSAKSDECHAFVEDLLCLAKCAKHELLKEKMKKIFEAKIGKKLDKVAAAAAEAVLACLNQKMAEKQACDDFTEKLMAAFKS
jgi:hypothetical protein